MLDLTDALVCEIPAAGPTCGGTTETRRVEAVSAHIIKSLRWPKVCGHAALSAGFSKMQSN